MIQIRKVGRFSGGIIIRWNIRIRVRRSLPFFFSGAKEDLIGLIEREVEGASGRAANQSWAFDSLLTVRTARRESSQKRGRWDHRQSTTALLPHPTPPRAAAPLQFATGPHLCPPTPPFLPCARRSRLRLPRLPTRFIPLPLPLPLPARDLHSCHPLSPRRRWWRIRGGRAEGGSREIFPIRSLK